MEQIFGYKKIGKKGRERRRTKKEKRKYLKNLLLPSV
jgi:hypothetical protein